ncbi:MAG: hypothetical protein P8M30_14650 [Planctomycetaceae bacterium]|nr:hypothetical protein [Planctomycetaceae bacterium]
MLFSQDSSLFTHHLPSALLVRLLLLSGLFLSNAACWAEAPSEKTLSRQQLEEFGLLDMSDLQKQEASAVRGSALQTSHSGVSFISGMLFDPSTSSVIKGHSIQLSSASDFVEESNLTATVRESSVNWAREISLETEATFVDLDASMRGLIQATGFALSAY